MKSPSMNFDQSSISQFDQALRNEWLITNGLGGYSSSTILGINNRKYHALLVTALRPPGERTVILSKLDEDVEFSGKTYQLGANDFQHDIYPQGFKLLDSFSLDPLPVFTYKVSDVTIKKKVLLPFEKNSCVVHYEILNPSTYDSTIRIYPLISYRHFHYTINRRERPLWISQNQSENTVELAFDNPVSIAMLKAIDGIFSAKPIWIEGIFYREEANRGEASMDETYQPGYFEFKAPKNSTTKFAVEAVVDENREAAMKSLDDLGSTINNIEYLFSKEYERRKIVLNNFYDANKQVAYNDGLGWLLQAAKDFIVKGTNDRRFVIAGYHWFGSWGRDTFVSLPGLMLTNGMFEDAKSVILDYTNYCKQGLIPNLIDDKTGEPLYNTVDGTLWYINSIFQYLKYTADFQFIKYLWSTLKDIISNHKTGTINNIVVDNDGLLSHGPQLTWMDTIVDGAPFTPRAGKAVEVQALWFNALKIMQFLAERNGESSLAQEYLEMAKKAESSFEKIFWNNDKQCLFDVIDESGKADYSIRPNQVIATALDYPIIAKERANLVVNFVQSELLTPMGLRTLSPRDSRYRGKYEGDRSNRDRSYHNGSIWPWLTGPLTTAYLKINGYGISNLNYAYENFMKALFTDELRRGGLGTLNEINDGDPPYTPRGCIAQAWSVAEPLRAYTEDILQIRPKYENEIQSKMFA